MVSETTSNPSFQVGRIWDLSWKLLSQNIVLWLGLGMGVYFLSYFLIEKVQELLSPLTKSGLKLFEPLIANVWELITDYTYEILDNDLMEILQPMFSGFKISKESASNLVNSVIYLNILQVVVSQVIHYMLWSERPRISLKEAIKRFWETDFNQRLDLASTVFKTICISIAYFGITAIYLLVCFSVLFLVVFSTAISSNFIIIFPIISYIGLIFYFSRWSLAVPVTAIEKEKVVASFKRSWHMTASYKVKIFGVFILILMIYLAIYLIVILSVFAYQMTFNQMDIDALPTSTITIDSAWGNSYSLFMLIQGGFYNLIVAVILSVCYYEIQNAEGRGKLKPLLAKSDWSSLNPNTDIPA